MTTAECGRLLNEWAAKCDLVARPVGEGTLVMVGKPGFAVRVTLDWRAMPCVEPLGAVPPAAARRLQALMRAYVHAA